MIKHPLDKAKLDITLLRRSRLMLDFRISLNLYNKSNVTLGMSIKYMCMTTWCSVSVTTITNLMSNTNLVQLENRKVKG